MKIKKNALEWAVFGSGMILVLALLGVLVREAVRAGGDAPKLEITFGSPARSGGMVRYPMTVRNSGNTTALEVQIIVGLVQGNQPIERSLSSFPFVPRKSEREAEILFRDAGAGGSRPIVVSVAYQTQ